MLWAEGGTREELKEDMEEEKEEEEGEEEKGQFSWSSYTVTGCRKQAGHR